MTLNWPMRIMAMAAVLAASVASARSEISSLKFEPLELNYQKHCVGPPKIKTDRDWQQWQGEKVATPSQKLVDLADAYANGLGGLPRDITTAKRLLEYLKNERRYADGRTTLISARILFDEKSDREAMAEAVKELEKEFERGNTSAAYLLGQAYEFGTGVTVDKKKAVEFYRLSATLDNTNAMIRTVVLLRSLKADEAEINIAAVGALTNLVSAVESGDCTAANVLYHVYRTGELGVLDTDLAMRWYDIIAKAGNTRAAMRLGNFYRQGRSRAPDLKKALFYTEMAAKAGDPMGAIETGRAYALGLGTPVNVDRAVRYLEQAGEAEVDKAWFELARMFSPEVNPGADPRVRFRYLDRGSKVEKPDTSLLEDYADALLNGIGTSPNQKAAILPLQMATDAGSAAAAWTLGKLYFYGSADTPQDKKLGLKLIRFAATSGEPAASSLLATLYRCGSNVERSIEKADQWQQRAGFSGSSKAMYALSARDTANDPLLQELYLRQAVRNGSGKAVVDLVDSYKEGRWGKPDSQLAVKWEQYANNDDDRKLRDDVRFSRALELKSAGDPQTALTLLSEDEFQDKGRAAFESARVVAAIGGNQAAIEDLLKQAVENKNSSAMWELSLMAAKSGGLVLGHDKSYWIQAAAERGHVKARIAIAEGNRDANALQSIFNTGDACAPKELIALASAVLSVEGEKAREKALDYVSTAEGLIEAGDRASLTSVGEALLSLGTDKHTRERGESILKQAAADGDTDAARRLGIALAATAKNTSDMDTAIAYLMIAAKPGDDKPMKIVLASLRSSSPTNAPKVFEALNKTVQSLSTPLLKKVQELSFGEDEVAELANSLIENAAQRDNPSALVILADRKFSGFRSQRDIPAGIALLQKAAKTGDPEAMKALAAAYEAGFGVPQNDGQAKQIRAGVKIPKSELVQ